MLSDKTFTLPHRNISFSDTRANKNVTYFMSNSFGDDCFASCEDVVNPSTSGPAMQLLCGPWGAGLCTPERWFNYMGSTSNGYSPFDIVYELSDGEERIVHNPSALGCDQPTPDEVIKQCI